MGVRNGMTDLFACYNLELMETAKSGKALRRSACAGREN
jgi:hypothetical protein